MTDTNTSTIISDILTRTAKLEEHSRYVDIWEQKQNGTLQKMSGQLEKLDEKFDHRFERINEKLDQAAAAIVAQQAIDRAELTKKINDDIQSLREQETSALRYRLNIVIGFLTALALTVIGTLLKIFLEF